MAATQEQQSDIVPLLPPEIAERVVFMNGPTHPELGIGVAAHLGVEIADIKYRNFKDTSQYTRVTKSNRRETFVAFQTHAAVGRRPETDSFYRHLHMIEAAKRARAGRVIAVAPSYMGDRQDIDTLPGEVVSTTLNARLLCAAGLDEFVTVDVHERRSLEAFWTLGKSAENYTARRMLADYLSTLIVGDRSNYGVLSPDAGRHKDSRKTAKYLGIKVVGEGLNKDRDPDEEEITHSGDIGDVQGMTLMLNDDVLSTGKTLMSSAREAHEAGAANIYAALTHAQFSGNAAEQLAASHLDLIVVTNTQPIKKSVVETLGSKLVILDADETIARGLANTVLGESNSEYFDNQNY